MSSFTVKVTTNYIVLQLPTNYMFKKILETGEALHELTLRGKSNRWTKNGGDLMGKMLLAGSSRFYLWRRTIHSPLKKSLREDHAP